MIINLNVFVQILFFSFLKNVNLVFEDVKYDFREIHTCRLFTSLTYECMMGAP